MKKAFKIFLGFFVFAVIYGIIRNQFYPEESSEVKIVKNKIDNRYKSALSYIDSLNFEKATQIADELALESEGIKASKKIDSIILKNKSTYLEKLTAIQNNCLKKVDIDHDDFEKITWYKPDFEKNNYKGGIYCYFGMKDNGSTTNPRLVITYYGDDWIFWNKANFLIDDKTLTYLPESSPKHTNSSSVWETSDEGIDEAAKIIINSMFDAKVVKYRLEGSQGVRDFKLYRSKILAMKNILDLHNAMVSIYILKNIN